MLYINSSRKTAAQIKSELGCDAIINGGWYNMSTFQPVMFLRADGKTLAAETYRYNGYGWNTNDLRVVSSSDMNTVRNFIACVMLIENGKAISPLQYGADVGGVRGRTAMGLTNDGQLLLFTSQDSTPSATTPEGLRDYLLSLGCVSAVMLDGGTKSQCIFPSGQVNSTYRVHNYICVWTGAQDKTPTQDECPFNEPTYNIKQGSMGIGAKWVQWHLNKCGANLVVDGVFGVASGKALIVFQMEHNLTSDGICGALTRAELKKAANAAKDPPVTAPVSGGSTPVNATTDADDSAISKLATVRIMSPFCSARTHMIDTITIHHTAAAGVSAQRIGNEFARQSRNASSNYGIGVDGDIGCYVPENMRARTSSNSANDDRAITIEVSNSTVAPDWLISQASYNALIELLADICRRNNIKMLLWQADPSLIGQIDKQNMTVHKWFAYTECPGKYLYNRMGQIAYDTNKKLQQTASSASQPVSNTVPDSKPVACPFAEPMTNLKQGNKGDGVKWLQWHLRAYGADIELDGDFGPATRSALVKFQTAKGLVADAICGTATRSALKAAVGSLGDDAAEKAYKATLVAKREKMLDYIEKRVGDLYVYGSQGEEADSGVIDWSAKCFPGNTTQLRANRMKSYAAAHKTNEAGEKLRAVDCSGLFWAAENEYELPLVDGVDIDDSTADGLYNTYCVPISKADLQPLDLVFTADLTHMGIVGRNGKIYEAAGSDIGVVCNDNVDARRVKSIFGTAYGCSDYYTKSPWTKFGRLKIYAEMGL